MRYFVIGDDGNRFGPADLTTLNQWAAEGRILAHQLLEPEFGGARVRASELPGLALGPAVGGGYAPGAAVYPRASFADASKDMNNAWIYGVLSLICCPLIFGILGLNAAKAAESKGANAMGPKILCYVGLALWVLGFIVNIATIGSR